MTDVHASTPLRLTTEEAVRLVQRSERERARWCLAVRLDARIVDDEDHIYRDSCSTYLNLSRADALHVVRTMLSKTLEEKGGRIPIARNVYGDRVTYWIGH